MTEDNNQRPGEAMPEVTPPDPEPVLEDKIEFPGIIINPPDSTPIDCTNLDALTPLQLELARAELKRIGGGSPTGLDLEHLTLLVSIQRRLRRTATAGAPGRAKAAKEAKPQVDLLSTGGIPKL